MRRRSLDELLTTDSPAWPELSQAIGLAASSVTVAPPDESAGEELLALQVTLRSTLGAVVYHTGGILIDHGWVRLLGSGGPALGRSITEWNAACGIDLDSGAPPLLHIGDDALGGQFALNGGEFPGSPGEVFYFAPETLRWEGLGRGYSDFVAFLFTGDLAAFYASWRWPGWQAESAALPGDRAFSIYPPLWAAGPPAAERSRTIVPLKEAVALAQDFAAKLGKSRSADR